MKEIYHDIFIGNEQDYYAIQRESNWAILHCCKHPFHCQFVGYRGTLPPTHPNYALKRIENEMALNLVDMDRFSENYLDFNRDMFDTAFSFFNSHKKADNQRRKTDKTRNRIENIQGSAGVICGVNEKYPKNSCAADPYDRNKR